MVRMRLTRIGGRKDPVWRVVVADQRSKRDGRIIETVGQYNAQTNPSTIKLDEERVRAWLARGAQPTDTVRKLLRTQGIDPARLPAPPPNGVSSTTRPLSGECSRGLSVRSSCPAATALRTWRCSRNHPNHSGNSVTTSICIAGRGG